MKFFVNTFLTFLIFLLKVHCKKMGDVHFQPRLLGLFQSVLCTMTTSGNLLPFSVNHLLVNIISIFLLHNKITAVIPFSSV